MVVPEEREGRNDSNPDLARGGSLSPAETDTRKAGLFKLNKSFIYYLCCGSKYGFLWKCGKLLWQREEEK